MESNGKGLNHRTVTVMGRQRWSMQLCRLRISWADRRRYCPLAAFLYKRYGLPWLSGVWCNINLPSALSLSLYANNSPISMLTITFPKIF